MTRHILFKSDTNEKRKYIFLKRPFISINIILLILFFVISSEAQIAYSCCDYTVSSSELNVNTEVSVPYTEQLPYYHRGDWEPPDILLLAENEEWQEAVDTIAAAADNDMTPVYMLMDEHNDRNNTTTGIISQDSNIFVLNLLFDSPWIRDYGPVQVKGEDGSFKWIDFFYSQDRRNDDAVPGQLASYMEAPIENSDYYLDGGAVISNGNGLCAITDSSLEKAAVDQVHPEEFERFKELLGCRELAVIPALTGESTGHADMIAQFLSPDTVAVSMVEQDDLNTLSDELESAVMILQRAAKKMNHPLKVIRIPIVVEGDLFYSYVNGTRLKDTYLMPSFHGVPQDIEDKAVDILYEAIPGIEMALIPADTIIKKGGAVHCITLGLSLPVSNKEPEHWVKIYSHSLSPDAMVTY